MAIEPISLLGIPLDAKLADVDASTLTGPIYFSLDGLDPSCAPGVSHHDPGGLTVLDVLDVLDVIDARPGPIVGADVVELNPTRDLIDMTAMVGAKFVKELAGATLARRPMSSQ